MLIAPGTEVRPLHQHDCDCCCFLGQVGKSGRHDTEYQDVWYCTDEQTLILRFGVDGDYMTVNKDFPYPGNHPSHDAWHLVQNWELEGRPTADLKDSDEMEWEEGYETVVGLYRDLKVKKTERNIFLRDRHGNPLGVAKILKHPDTDLVRAYRFEPYEELPLEGLPMRKDFHSTKALYLYAMMLDQEMEDGGH